MLIHPTLPRDSRDTGENGTYGRFVAFSGTKLGPGCPVPGRSGKAEASGQAAKTAENWQRQARRAAMSCFCRYLGWTPENTARPPDYCCTRYEFWNGVSQLASSGTGSAPAALATFDT
jgi:hypothetical protein